MARQLDPYAKQGEGWILGLIFFVAWMAFLFALLYLAGAN
jgi:hypothetical protein